MSSTPTLPLEIDETIIDLLAEDRDDDNGSALRACSLVCRSFLPLGRKHIFASIFLSFPGASSLSPTTRKLERLLSRSPEIAGYIRRLDYNIETDDFTSPSIQECLKRISRLQYLGVWHHNMQKLDWSNNPLRPALLRLLYLPTLTHFKVTAIDNFVLSDLLPCVNLKKFNFGLRTTVLTTDNFPANRSIRLNELEVGIRNTTSIMNICAAQRPDGQPVIDFSSLSKIIVSFQVYSDIEVLEKLFMRCKQLTDVYVSLWNPRLILPSLSNLLRPSMQTLRLLYLRTHIYDVDFDPLAGIPSELEDMRNKNIIENIIIKILIMGDGNCMLGDDWGKLDEVLTRSGWSSLREVSVTVELSLNDELEVALRKLPETQFSRLSASKSVSFKFNVTTIFE